MVWLLVKEADWILVYNDKGVWAESALLMDSEQLSGVSQLWVGHKKPKSCYFSEVILIIFAFELFCCVNLRLKQRCCFYKGQDCESQLKYNTGVWCESFHFKKQVCNTANMSVMLALNSGNWVKFRCLHQDIRNVDIRGWGSHPRLTLQSVEEKWAPSKSDSSQPKIGRSGNLPSGDACFSPLTGGKPAVTNSESNV